MNPEEEMEEEVPVEAEPEQEPAAEGPGIVQAAQEAPMEGESAAPGPGEEAATPEEEKAMEEAIMSAAQSIYQNQAMWDAFVKSLQSMPIEQAVAEATRQIVVKVDNELDLPETVVFQFAAMVSMMLTDAAIETGAANPDEEQVKQCLSESVQTILEEYGSDPAEIDSAVSQMNPDDVRESIKMLGVGNGK